MCDQLIEIGCSFWPQVMEVDVREDNDVRSHLLQWLLMRYDKALFDLLSVKFEGSSRHSEKENKLLLLVHCYASIGLVTEGDERDIAVLQGIGGTSDERLLVIQSIIDMIQTASALGVEELPAMGVNGTRRRSEGGGRISMRARPRDGSDGVVGGEVEATDTNSDVMRRVSFTSSTELLSHVCQAYSEVFSTKCEIFPSDIHTHTAPKRKGAVEGIKGKDLLTRRQATDEQVRELTKTSEQMVEKYGKEWQTHGGAAFDDTHTRLCGSLDTFKREIQLFRRAYEDNLSSACAGPKSPHVSKVGEKAIRVHETRTGVQETLDLLKSIMMKHNELNRITVIPHGELTELNILQMKNVKRTLAKSALRREKENVAHTLVF